MSKKENQQFIAHVRQNEKGEWLTHDLKEHCQKVGNLAAQFAGHFGESFAQFAGDYHDIGKYRKPFQERIRIKSGYNFDEEAHLEQKANKASHSHAGALLVQQNSAIGIFLAYIIAGHHTGLPDWINDKSACLSSRLRSDEAKTELTQALENLPDDFRKLPDDFAQLLPNFIKTGSLETLHIWIRFLFSCLVDADFLDTEQFMSPQKRVLRSGYPSLSVLEKHFSKYMRKLQRATKNTPINLIRSDIFQQCLDAGKTDASLFSLTVPTGGGKTLSSMAFALTHAIQFKKQRIIYAIPFTSIIEQNAQVFKHIFEYQDNQYIETCVLEHHSNLEQPLSEETTKNRLAAENWDVPIIVTTNVQLFESLFASRTSQCRKIHNIANSVIVLDEAQKIPSALSIL